MKRTNPSGQPSHQDTGSFRKLIERKISVDEYVHDLDRRTSELREETAPTREREPAKARRG